MKYLRIVSLISISILLTIPNTYARSNRNHVIKGTKHLFKALADPFHGLFILGPRKVKETWEYEVHGREKEEDRNTLRGKLFAIWRAPGDEFKGTIDGISNCTKNLGSSLKEFISIIFSD